MGPISSTIGGEFPGSGTIPMDGESRSLYNYEQPVETTG